MILINAKGQVLKDARRKPIKMCTYLPFTPVHLWICIYILDLMMMVLSILMVFVNKPDMVYKWCIHIFFNTCYGLRSNKCIKFVVYIPF